MAIYDPEDEQNNRSFGGNLGELGNSSKVDSPETLNQKENEVKTGNDKADGPASGSVAGGALKSAISDQVGKGFVMAAGPEVGVALKAIKGFQKFFGNHKKSSSAGIGITGGIIGLVLFGFGSVLPLEIVHIEENLLGYETKIEMYFEKKAAAKLIQKIINKNIGKTAAEEESTAAEAEASGEDLTAEMDNFDITSPGVVDALAENGITVETSPTGAFEGLKNSAGQNITEDIGNDGANFQEMESALPEYETSQVESFRPVMVDEAGASFSAIPPDTPEDKVQSVIESDVTDGASAAELAAASESEDGKQPTQQQGQTAAEEYTQASDTGGAIGSAVQAEDAALNAGETGSEALQAGVNSLSGLFSNPVFLAGFASTLCSIEQDVATAAKDRVPEIMSLLIRHGTTLLSLADELKTGNMNSGQLSQVMKLFNGDQSVAPTKADPRPVAAMPFTDSAAWQRATGGSVDTNPNDFKSPNYTPDISPASLPTTNSGTVLVDEVQGVLNDTGGGLACGFLTSPFSFVIQGALGGIQVFSDFGSFGGTQVAISAGIIAATGFLDYVVLPHVLEYFSPVGLSGSENSVQWLNNSDAGLNLASNNYARRIGANPVTNSTAATMYTEANQAQLALAAKQPWTYRILALSNPNSLASAILDRVPLGLNINSLVYNTLNSLTSIPSAIFGDLATAISPRAFALTAPAIPGAAYGLTQYSFTDSGLQRYDPIANEQYLFTTVSAYGQSIRRIDALGNPNTYTDTPSGDSNSNDLLHCYVDSYTLIIENINNASNNCGAVGTYDYGSDTPSPANLPNDSTIINIYCTALGNPPGSITYPGCVQQMEPQVDGHNDVGHFRQYLLDTHIMSAYNSLTTNT